MQVEYVSSGESECDSAAKRGHKASPVNASAAAIVRHRVPVLWLRKGCDKERRGTATGEHCSSGRSGRTQSDSSYQMADAQAGES